MIDELKLAGAAPDFRVKKNWPVERLWRVASLRSEKNRPELPLLSVFLNRGVIAYGEGGGQVHKPGQDLSVYQVVHEGDLVLNNQQAWRGSVGVSKYHGIISPAYVVLHLKDSLIPRFADYLFQSRVMVPQFVTASKGVGDIQRDIHMPWLKNIRVPLPSPDEQAAIVRFLDHANGRIERAIRAKRKLIALLNEQKQATIHRAVTRGLDPTVKLKPSGIPWLGNVPEHWDIKRIKYLMNTVDRRSATGDEVLLSMRKYHGLVPYHEHFHKPPQAATLKGFKLVKPGQIVVNRMQAGFGLIFSSTYDGLVSPDFGVFQPTGEVVPEFLGELFRSRDIRAQFQRESKGLGTGQSGFMRLYDDRIGIVHIAFPPSIVEQQKILSQLRDDVRGVENTIRMTEQEIALLLEYRTTLTAEVVTGKLDVREAAKRLPAEAVEPLPADDLPEDEDDVPEEADDAVE